MVFPASVIRKLAPSEDFFAETHTFTSVTVELKGPVDVDAMADAFDTLLEAHPVYAGHLEPGADGRYQIVADDLLHPGMWIIDDDDVPSPATKLDQSTSLIYLTAKPRGDRTELSLYVHHSLADGMHVSGLLFELFTFYTNAVATGSPGPANPQPAPESIEAILEQRGIEKGPRSGLDRFIPAMFVYDLPPKRPTNAGKLKHPATVPTARGQLSKEETTALVRFGRQNRLFVNNLVSAAILLAEWRVRETPHIPIPYVYNVNLRGLLDPPVAATACTNGLGIATYLARITPETGIVELAQEIAATLQADLADGVVQQSLLHMNMQSEGAVPGLPDVVLSTNLGNITTIQLPDGLEVVGFRSRFHRASSAVIDIYSFGVVGGRLLLEHHVDAPDAHKSMDLILALLRAAPLGHEK